MEAFANLYAEAARAIRARRAGRPPVTGVLVPDLPAGMRGMAFIAACQASAAQDAAWQDLAP